MTIEFSFFKLNLVIERSAELGAKQVLYSTGALKPYISKAEAFRLFGRANLERWIADGLITPRKDGDLSSRWRIDRLEAESIKYAIELSHLLY
jgi:hypothetical protein